MGDLKITQFIGNVDLYRLLLLQNSVLRVKIVLR